MRRFWIAVRFLVFMPVAALLVLGYILAGMKARVIWTKEGRDTIRRWWMTWWHWVTGEVSTYELIK
jgi:hypothetical protein